MWIITGETMSTHFKHKTLVTTWRSSLFQIFQENGMPGHCDVVEVHLFQLQPYVIVVVFVQTLIRYLIHTFFGGSLPIGGHTTGSNNSELEDYTWGRKQIKQLTLYNLFINVFMHPIYCLRPSFLSPSYVVVTQIRGHIAGSSPPSR